MIGGPYLIGAQLVVPSEWYSAAAVALWRSQNFAYDRNARQWTRHTSIPYRGITYKPERWLRQVRKLFFAVYHIDPKEKIT